MSTNETFNEQLNEQLEILYSEYFDQFINELSALGKKAFSYPLLLKIDEGKWENARLKIMIFGQETRRWRLDHQENNIQNLMNEYYSYYYKKKYNKARSMAFFKGFDRVKKYIQQYYEYQNDDIEILWNNINKVGKYSGTGVIDATRKIEREYFNVISREINILKPDLVIFFTGPHRDGDIVFNFNIPNENIQCKRTAPYSQNRKGGKYALINANDMKAVRLYHPASFGVCTNEYLEWAIKDWLTENSI